MKIGTFESIKHTHIELHICINSTNIPTNKCNGNDDLTTTDDEIIWQIM
jgi:hypothetical protein